MSATNSAGDGKWRQKIVYLTTWIQDGISMGIACQANVWGRNPIDSILKYGME